MLITENFNVFISSYINDILESDKINFKISSKNALINSIVLYYIKVEIEEIKKRAVETKKRLNLKINRDDIIKVYNELRRIENNKNNNYVKLNFRLNKETFTEFEDYIVDNEEDNIKFTSFFREVFQWYSDKKQYERESILYFKVLNMIKEELNPKNNRKKTLKLEIESIKNTEIEMVPLGIVVSKNENYSYLLGYTEIINQNTLEKTGKLDIRPIRISNISNIKFGKKYNIIEDENEKDSMYNPKKSVFEKADNMIKERITTFGEEFEISIALTEKGKNMLETIVHNRPFRLDKVKSENKNGEYIYSFISNDFATITYFFNFGKECRIIKPKELYDKFKTKYQDALKNYN